MGTDSRYLVITLIAVFVALSIGILVGVGITNSPSLEKLSKRINREFDTVRKENAALRAERDRSVEAYHAAERLIKNVLPSLVQGKLTGQQVALIVTGDLPDLAFLDEVQHVIELAGGTVASVTRIKAGFSTMTASELIEFEKTLGLSPLGVSILPKNVVSDLSQKIASGRAAAVLSSLRKSKWLEFSGRYDLPVQKAILVGGCVTKAAAKKDAATQPVPLVDRADSVDLPAIETLQSLKIPVVGTEPSVVTTSYMDTYQSREIPTVDNVDTEVGQVALVYALAGEAGNYGTKSSADKLLPTLQITPVK